MDVLNYAELDAALVAHACEDFMRYFENDRAKKYQTNLERNRKKTGWFWNRRDETDAEVVKRLGSDCGGYWELSVYKDPYENELEMFKLKRLAEAAYQCGKGKVLVNHYHGSLLHKFLIGEELLTE